MSFLPPWLSLILPELSRAEEWSAGKKLCLLHMVSADLLVIQRPTFAVPSTYLYSIRLTTDRGARTASITRRPSQNKKVNIQLQSLLGY